MRKPCGDSTNTNNSINQPCRTMLTRKRKLQMINIAGNDSGLLTMPVMGHFFSSEHMKDEVYFEAYCADGHIMDIADESLHSTPILSTPPTMSLSLKSSTLSHAPLVVTPDRRFEKPTAFISPITRTMQSASEVVQVNNEHTVRSILGTNSYP